MDLILKEGERLDDLEHKNLKIIQQTNGFCFGIDSILLSDYAKELKNNSVVLDFGCGNGILEVLLSTKTRLRKIIGIDIQQEVCELAKRTVTLNQLEERVEIHCVDLKKADALIENQSIDVIVTNPPYKKDGTGLKNEKQTKLIARHEVLCSFEDIAKMSSQLLKNNGSFYLVHRPERLVDIIFYLRKYHLEPKKMRFVYPSLNKAPNLVLIKAIKNGKAFLKIEEPLYIYQKDGRYTDEIFKIYGKEKIK